MPPPGSETVRKACENKNNNNIFVRVLVRYDRASRFSTRTNDFRNPKLALRMTCEQSEPSCRMLSKKDMRVQTRVNLVRGVWAVKAQLDHEWAPQANIALNIE